MEPKNQKSKDEDASVLYIHHNEDNPYALTPDKPDPPKAKAKPKSKATPKKDTPELPINAPTPKKEIPVVPKNIPDPKTSEYANEIKKIQSAYKDQLESDSKKKPKSESMRSYSIVEKVNAPASNTSLQKANSVIASRQIPRSSGVTDAEAVPRVYTDDEQEQMVELNVKKQLLTKIIINILVPLVIVVIAVIGILVLYSKFK